VCDGRCMPEQEKNKLNDLIKEFARQAGFKVNWQHEDVQAIKMAQYKEFAEKIIRECEKLRGHEDVLAPIGRSAWGEAYQEGWIEGTQQYIDTIKKHFGVKE